jgi:hypothetical protein
MKRNMKMDSVSKRLKNILELALIIIVLPDLMDTDNVVFLDRWEGSWSYLPTLKWVRISKAGHISKSSFPPKGKS